MSMAQQDDVDVCLWTVQVEQWPEDEALFALYLEVHRRRDKIALHMLPLDQHLHCPTFATLRIPSLTYPGTMGEPLHGEVCYSCV
jgi:mediator of RNA polymerase II transcription subunit 23